jgi:hypothetical protein
MDLLTILVIVLVVLWAMGAFVVHVGSAVHLLLVIVLIIVLVRVLQGRNVL